MMSDFEKELHAMFDNIWDCEIDHPLFQDTVGELMEAVIQAHEKHNFTHGTNLASLGTDCISRQSAIDALNHELRCGAVINQCGLEMAYEVIEGLPSTEPQIIRCKDCKNWDTTWTNDFSPNYHYCPMVDGVRKEDWFCADAERKTDE